MKLLGKGLVGLVPLLLQKGASVNWTREDGWTPLMSACSALATKAL